LEGNGDGKSLRKITGQWWRNIYTFISSSNGSNTHTHTHNKKWGPKETLLERWHTEPHAMHVPCSGRP